METPQNTGFLKQPNRWNRIKTDATGGPGGPITPPRKAIPKLFRFPCPVSGAKRPLPIAAPPDAAAPGVGSFVCWLRCGDSLVAFSRLV